MALTERLALLVSLDANGAIRGLEKVGHTAARELGRAETRTDRMAKGFQKAGVGMIGTAGLLGAGLYRAGQSAADLEQAIGGTEAVFHDSAGTIDRFAKNAATKMGLSERAFREATSRMGGSLKGLGFEVDEAADRSVELTGVAADLAATYGGTTAEAVDALAAAFRGEADPAERFNLFLNQTRVNAKAVELGLAETTAKVDAHAKAQATLALIMEQSADAQGQFGREAGTAAGQMAIANAQLENAKAALGQSVAPIIADVAGGLAGLAGGFQSVNEKSDGFLSKLAAFGTIGLAAGGGIAWTVGKLVEMRDTLAPLGGRLRTAEGGLTRLGKGLTGLGIAATVAGFVQMSREAEKLHFDVDQLASSVASLSEEQKKSAGDLLVFLDQWGQLDELVSQTADSNVLAAERLLEVAEAAGISGDKMAELRDIVESKREADVQGAKDQAAYADQVTEAAGATGGLTEQLKEQEEALQGVLDATLAQFDANIGYRRSVDDVEDSLADLAATQKEHGTDSEEYRDALLDAEAALLDQADAAVRLYEDTVTAAGGTLTAQQKTAIYRESLIKLRDSLAPNSPLRVALQAYIDQLNKIPSSVSTTVSIRGIVEGQAARFNSVLAQLDGPRAAGGPVLSGGRYLVGEQGPEILQMGSTSGFVYPNGTGGGGTIVIPVSIDGREIDRIVVDANARTVRRGYAA